QYKLIVALLMCAIAGCVTTPTNVASGENWRIVKGQGFTFFEMENAPAEAIRRGLILKCDFPETHAELMEIAESLETLLNEHWHYHVYLSGDREYHCQLVENKESHLRFTNMATY
ncbi:MAG TPA: hypothetical protein DIW43_15660, partial [Spongiibacteraceae bacterium]|nr:hypothetical protein [Spongiibacteraceae bacterium]